MDPLEHVYTNASIILRPARVAIVFRGGEHWRGWARLMISVAGKYWGGAGFILVPYNEGGSVAPELLDVVAAYDPDHVVTVRLTLREMERAAPGFVSLRSDAGLPIVREEERLAFLERVDLVDLPQLDAAARRARDLVSAACTPLRNAFGPTDEDQHESVEQLDFEVGTRSGWLVPAAREVQDSIVLAGSELWKGDGSLSLAIRTGILPFALEKRFPEPREEPDQAEMIKLSMTPERWSRKASDDLVQTMNVRGDSTAEGPQFWFDEPDGGLTSMRHRWSSEGGAIVVGDSAEDFALAYAYERLLGFGLWLTPAMVQNEHLAPVLQTGLAYAGQRVQGNAQNLRVTSVSLDREALSDLSKGLHIETLNVNPFGVHSSGELERTRDLPDGVSIGRPELRLGLHQLAVGEPFETSVSVPVTVGQDGTVCMRAPLAAPLPAKEIPQRHGRSTPYWYVGVNFSETSMPSGRGVPQEFVQPDPQRYTNSAVRSSREGLSFHSQAAGVVPAGASLSSQLFKPKLKVLGMQPWVQAMVRRADMEAQPSVPGMHAQLLARRLGGRQALVTMVAGPFHPALRRFASSDKNKPAKRTDKVFPSGDGVALGYDPYPRFEALRSALPGVADRDIRQWIDQLSMADLLRRGFILDCSDCTRPSFVGLDQAGERFECVRCSAVNDLTAARWNNHGAEPSWFYDLHPSFREVMAENGDVGLFAARRLQRGSWGYSDTAEIQFSRTGTGTRIAEIDLIAHVNGEVVLVEAKSNGKLGSSRAEAQSAARKKIEIAVALHADRIILATTEPRFTESATAMVREAARNAGAKLRVEELVGLGPEIVHELSFDI